MLDPNEAVLYPFDPGGHAWRPIYGSEILSMRRHEEINGEHRIDLECTRILLVGLRVLCKDSSDHLTEWVVNDGSISHDAGATVGVGTYQLVWSMQYDLSTTYLSEYGEIGLDKRETYRPSDLVKAAMFGAQANDYHDGETIVTGNGNVLWGLSSMYDIDTTYPSSRMSGHGESFVGLSVWDRLKAVTDEFEWELYADVQVTDEFPGDGSSGATIPVITRNVRVVEKGTVTLGYEQSGAMFTFENGISSIHYEFGSGPHYERVVPLGKWKSQTSGDGKSFTYPLTINSRAYRDEYNPPQGMPSSFPYIDHDSVAARWRRVRKVGEPASSGTLHPTRIVKYDSDDCWELYEMALKDLASNVEPEATLSAEVVGTMNYVHNLLIGCGHEAYIRDDNFAMYYDVNDGTLRPISINVPCRVVGIDDDLVTGDRRFTLEGKYDFSELFEEVID